MNTSSLLCRLGLWRRSRLIQLRVGVQAHGRAPPPTVDKRCRCTLHYLQAITAYAPLARRRFAVHYPVKLSRQQFEQVQHALYSSFNRDELRTLVRTALGQELEAVSQDRDLSLQLFDVILWAETHDKVPDLLAAACDLRPGSVLLQQLRRDAVAWQEEPCDDAPPDYSPQAAVPKAYRPGVVGSLSSPERTTSKGRSWQLVVGPLVVMALVLAAAFWMVRAARPALPGDAAYPLKQWLRERRLNLVPADQRGNIIAAGERELADEARLLAGQQTRLDARTGLSIENTEPMVYYGSKGDLLLIGPFLVAPNYQPAAGVEEFRAMEVEGALVPGAVVQLTYRVLPGNPNVVQGVRAVVVDSPNPAPTPTTAPAPVRAGECRRTLPASWVPYPLRPGDTLTKLADRAGVSVIDIMRVNCLEAATLVGVSQIYLPQRVYVRVTPPAMPATPTIP